MAGAPQHTLHTCKYSSGHEHVDGFYIIAQTGTWEVQSANRERCEIIASQRHNKTAHLYVLVEMDGLIVDIVPHEEVVDTRQKGHLRQGEDVHELLHCMAVCALQ